MNKDVLERAVLPVAIPLAAIVVVEIVVFAFSRVLLTAGKTPSVAIALGAALAILLGAAAIAAAPRIRPTTIQGLLAIVLLGSIGAGAWAYERGPAPIEGHEAEGAAGEHEPGAGAPDDGRITIVAENIAFDTEELEVPAGAAFDLVFDNKDAAIPHNVAIYSDDQLSEELFKGEIFNGADERTYEVAALEAGEYYFHCDVHPAMNGTLVAS